MNKKANINAISSHLPNRKVTNDDLAKEFQNWDVEKITQKTGILERRIADVNECASDLGIKAAKKLFKDHDITPQKIDFLLFCTQSPDYLLPSTACQIQTELALPTTCGALDFNLGCSGFVYGLSLAKGLIESEAAQSVLLITAETYSKYLHKSDKSNRTIFGDGAAATLISSVNSEKAPIGPFVFGTDGRGKESLIVPAGGSRLKTSEKTKIEKEISKGLFRTQENLHMNGGEIFNFTINTIPSQINALLNKSNLSMDQIDYFIFHQANSYILEHLRKKINIPQEKFCIDMAYVGNTVSSTIPIALENAMASKKVKKGERVMLVGFGVGLSWALCIIDIE